MHGNLRQGGTIPSFGGAEIFPAVFNVMQTKQISF